VTVLPPSVRAGVESALTAMSGDPVDIRSTEQISGGCINSALRVQAGEYAYFLKWNDASPPAHFFSSEATGLDALRDASRGSAGGLRVPEVVSVAPDWLLLEFVERGSSTARVPERETYFQALGRGLAGLHAGTISTEAGGPDNFIGSLPQENEHSLDWPSFWWERRLQPQIERARSAGHLGGKERETEELRRGLPALLAAADQEGFSLLHGDLWSGNVFPGPENRPVLIDPSCYHGHREVDIAMTELFGGFDRGFYDAYSQEWPLQPGYEARRRDAYQLYPLLVHLNLFGSSYEAGVRAAIGRLIR
jgi:fructosamine-3-kinase